MYSCVLITTCITYGNHYLASKFQHYDVVEFLILSYVSTTSVCCSCRVTAFYVMFWSMHCENNQGTRANAFTTLLMLVNRCLLTLSDSWWIPSRWPEEIRCIYQVSFSNWCKWIAKCREVTSCTWITLSLTIAAPIHHETCSNKFSHLLLPRRRRSSKVQITLKWNSADLVSYLLFSVIRGIA